MHSNRDLHIRKGYSWPELGKSEARCPFCTFNKKLISSVQAEGVEKLSRHEANGKPNKIKPEVPPKPKRKLDLVVTENQKIIPSSETKNEAVMIPKQGVKLEVRPEEISQTKPEVIMQNGPDVKSLTKTEVKEGQVRRSEPEQRPLDYPRVEPADKLVLFPLANPEVKSPTKPDEVTLTKSKVILHTNTRVIRQNSEVVIPTSGNKAEGEDKPTRTVRVSFQATLQVRRLTKEYVTFKAEPQPKPEVIRQTGGACVLTPKSDVEPNQDMIFKRNTIPFSETQVKLHPQNVATSMAGNKLMPAAIPQVIRQADEVNFPKPKVEATQGIKGDAHATPVLLPLSKPEVKMQPKELVIPKPENKPEQGAEPSQCRDFVKTENNIKLKAKLNQEVNFKPQLIPDVFSLSKPEVILQSNEVISKLENIFKQKAEESQGTDIPKEINNTKLEPKLNKEVSFNRRFVPDVLSLAKPEVKMQSKSKLNSEPSLDTEIPNANKIKLKSKWEKEFKLDVLTLTEQESQVEPDKKMILKPKLKEEVYLRRQFMPDVLPLTKPEVILQSKKVVFSKPENNFKLIAEPSQETGTPKAYENVKSEAKLNEEEFCKPRFVPDVLSLTKPDVKMQSNEVGLSKPEHNFKLIAGPREKTDIPKSDKRTNLGTKLNEEVYFKRRFELDVPLLSKPEVKMQSKDEVLSKPENRFKLKAVTGKRTISKPENRCKAEADLNQEVIFKRRFKAEIHSLGKPDVIMQSKEIIPNVENKIQRKAKPSQLEDELNQEDIFKPEVAVQSQDNPADKPSQEPESNRCICEVWDMFKTTGRIHPEDEAKLQAHVATYDYSDVGNIDLSHEESDEFLLVHKAKFYLDQRYTERIFCELERMRHEMRIFNETTTRQINEDLDKWFRDKARWAREFRL
ncbi:titin-like [Drosophila biarmipes]|uniref:titin-like n=1 Tax=Drosophila biarmipes TaxID=125945 RepID=UPI0007E70961|nr:titin-like [Drosophila biarmipes]XP_050742702.1 titin-like [Drosophila biarmipes]